MPGSSEGVLIPYLHTGFKPDSLTSSGIPGEKPHIQSRMTKILSTYTTPKYCILQRTLFMTNDTDIIYVPNTKILYLTTYYICTVSWILYYTEPTTYLTDVVVSYRVLKSHADIILVH